MKKLLKNSLLLGLASCSLFACKKEDDPVIAQISEKTVKVDCAKSEVSTNTTWKDVVSGDAADYVVSCPITVVGSSVLTIEPGVIIRFEGAESGIFTTENSGLKAVGTADKPIKLLGKNPVKGAWQGVYFGSNNPVNQLDFVTIQHAGAKASGKTEKKGALQLNTRNVSRASITNCTISDNEGYGLYAAENTNLYSFGKNKLSNNSLSPVGIYFNQLDKLDIASEYKEGNGQPYIEAMATRVEKDLSIQAIHVPYRITAPNYDGKVYIYKALTIAPGTILEFNTGTGIQLGSLFERTGSLNAVGTADKRITFRGVVEGQGAWIGIGLNSVSPLNKLIHCNITGGGATQMYYATNNGKEKGNIVLVESGTTVTVQQCTISNSLNWGIYKDDSYQKTNLTQSGNTFGNNKAGDIK